MSHSSTPLPQRLGRYEILDRLAYGGMAEIFLARERGMGGLERVVVIKRILPHLAAKPELVEMFLQEARLVAPLSHPNVVQIHELGQEQEDFFIAMEYIAGSSVRELLAEAAKRNQLVPLGVAVGIAAQACAGAHAAHELKDGHGEPIGVVHRDVTPHNLMVTAEGHVKLLDFGVAKPTLQQAEGTLFGSLKGKLCYLSPEQYRYAPLDRRSDIFSLGVVLWEMLTCRRLYKREGELEVVQAITEEPPPNPRELRPEIPLGVVAVVTCALAKDRGERFSSAGEMRRALLGAADEAGLDTSTDAIGDLVRQLCGDAQLRSRERIEEVLDRVTESSSTRRVTPGADLFDDGSIHDADTMITGPGPLKRGKPGPPGERAPRGWGKLALRLVAALFALGGVAAALWWARSEPPVTVAGATVVVGFAPAMSPEVLVSEMTPLADYLQRQTGRPFRLEVATSYRELSDRLLGGRYHFALLPPNSYIETSARDPRDTVALAARYGGSQGSDGVLLVREDSDIHTEADLRGKRLCFPDPESTSGYLLPRMHLLKAGVDPDRELEAPHRSGNHQQALLDLLEGRCDATGTFHSNFVSAGRSGVAVSQLRVLALTGRLPHEAFCASPATSVADRRLVVQALAAFDPPRHINARWLGQVQRISGFDRVEDGAYDDLRAALGKASAVDSGSEDVQVKTEDAGR